MRFADEFTQNLDSKITLPVVIPFIQQLLQSQQYIHRSTAFFSSIYAKEIIQSIITAIKGVDIDVGGGIKVRRNPCFPVQLMGCRMTTTLSDNVSKSILKENCQIQVQVMFELLYQNQQYMTEMANSESEKNNELQRIEQQLLTSSTTQLDQDIINTKFSNKLKAEGCEQYFSDVCPIVMSGLIGERMSRIDDIGSQIACIASQQDKEYQSGCIDCVMALFSGIGKEKAGQYLNQFMGEIIKIEKEMIFDPIKSQLQLNQQQQQQSSDQTSSLQHKIYKDESDPRIRSIESLYVRFADLVKEQFVPTIRVCNEATSKNSSEKIRN
ncbi:MAG: hypothetical protein EZS28_014960 [Streblomastix strix]|uniref:Uncharacterized protein n=1 Tax=Streblomastix strix TaxID=222440 RepID=A0A5J4W406_9EUKA|nr:MAG: hypothetical protein EZS28_014960 [Streblomastix strix]